MLSSQRYLPDLIALILACLVQLQLGVWAAEYFAKQAARRLRRLLPVAVAFSCAWISFSFFFSIAMMAEWLPGWYWLAWVRGLGVAWALISVFLFFGLLFVRRLPEFDPERRKVLKTARAALFATPFAVVGFGFVQRNNFQLCEVEVSVPGLAKDLHGLRIAQLSDIHLSPFLNNSQLEYVVGMANETKPHLSVVLGDLITAYGDPLDDCLRILSSLKADAGILACLGNHEIYANAEDHAEREGARRGITFLRGANRRLRFGAAELNVAGVDYQRTTRPYLEGAGNLVAPGALNLLLSHNPDVFPVAARQGFDLTLAGHTHGGQVTIEILSQHLNLARFITPYVHGLYREGSAHVYVTRGIGTVGVPVRVGAPPEVTLLRLCAT